jgi:predicted ArsR family transcriptional regulator
VLVALCRPLLDDEVFASPASVREIAAALVVTDAAVKQHLLHLCHPRAGRRRVQAPAASSETGFRATVWLIRGW